MRSVEFTLHCSPESAVVEGQLSCPCRTCAVHLGVMACSAAMNLAKEPRLLTLAAS
jgi:hypothetical protein